MNSEKSRGMKQQFKDYLFSKGYLVNDSGENREECAQVLFSLANLFGLRITRGQELAVKEMIRDAGRSLGIHVPEPFYKGFPKSVLALTSDQLLLDQLIHYSITYGMGDFSQPGHSLLEEQFERAAFKEKTNQREFAIITAEEGYELLWDSAENLLHSSRPLNDVQLELAVEFARRYPERIQNCNCKDTVFRLIRETEYVPFAANLQLPDIVKMAEAFQWMNDASKDSFCDRENGQAAAKPFHLNLKNQDRKLISSVLDWLLEQPEPNIRDCYEKRKKWVGLLHHIHYVPKNDTARQFAADLRGKGPNLSVYASFEKEMGQGSIPEAAEILSKQKGSGAAARNLNYMLSRCRNQDEIRIVLEKLGNPNAILLLQLLMQYHCYHTGRRTFKFVNGGMMTVHTESDEEMARRRTVLPKETQTLVQDIIRQKLDRILKKKSIGKVYVENGMEKIAVPIQESVSSSGLGVLPKGSRISIPPGNKIRCFTYWEEVDDIDLAAFGLSENGRQQEFSWRTMSEKQSDACVFSGDETSGFNGGSEYFDIMILSFREQYPALRYIVFTNNVYSGGVSFNQAFCKAGFMIREENDSGRVYEPKTVSTAFRIQGDGTFAYLFALDLQTREIIWLNISMNSREAVAGRNNHSVMMDYFEVLDVMNLAQLFKSMASETTDDPADADVIVADYYEGQLKETQILIRSCDMEKVLSFLN